MIKFTNKKQITIILSFFFVISLLSITLNSYFFKKEKPKTQTTLEKKQEKKEVFEIKNKPQEGAIETAIDNLALTFSFSKEIDKSSVFIQIKPDTEFGIFFSADNKSLSVYPKERWIYEQDYLLEIDLKSIEKDELKEKIFHNFKLKKPKYSPMDESKIEQ